MVENLLHFYTEKSSPHAQTYKYEEDWNLEGVVQDRLCVLPSLIKALSCYYLQGIKKIKNKNKAMDSF